MVFQLIFDTLNMFFREKLKIWDNCLHRDPNDIFVLKDKEKNSLKSGHPGFYIFPLLFEIKVFFYAKHVSSDKNKLENHSLENQN